LSFVTLSNKGVAELAYSSSTKISSSTSLYLMIVFVVRFGDLNPALEMLYELSEGVSIFVTLMLKLFAMSAGG
jgi:hypothetical protein